MEKDLSFLGVMVMENRLKPETTPVIHQLDKANIRTSEYSHSLSSLDLLGLTVCAMMLITQNLISSIAPLI